MNPFEFFGLAPDELEASFGYKVHFHPGSLLDLALQHPLTFQGIEEGINPAVAHGKVESLEDGLDDVIPAKGLVPEEGEDYVFEILLDEFLIDRISNVHRTKSILPTLF